jgi:hypothetical protein
MEFKPNEVYDWAPGPDREAVEALQAKDIESRENAIRRMAELAPQIAKYRNEIAILSQRADANHDLLAEILPKAKIAEDEYQTLLVTLRNEGVMESDDATALRMSERSKAVRTAEVVAERTREEIIAQKLAGVNPQITVSRGEDNEFIVPVLYTTLDGKPTEEFDPQGLRNKRPEYFDQQSVPSAPLVEELIDVPPLTEDRSAAAQQYIDDVNAHTAAMQSELETVSLDFGESGSVEASTGETTETTG